MKKIIVFFIAIFLCQLVYSQHQYRIGLLPAINVNTKIADAYKLNFKVESRSIFKEGVFSEASSSKFDYSLIDLSTILGKKIGVNNSLAGGYLIRIKDDEFRHRFIQQFTMVKRYYSFRLGHRFSADQSFQDGTKPEVRLRYRLALEIPLNGQSVDDKEFYLKLSNEYLNAFNDSDYDLEIRVIPFLGYVIADSNKFEAGVNYRINNFVNDATRSSFWLSLNWYVSI